MSCPACFSGFEHSHGSPKGSITTLHGVECYVTPPLDQPLPNNSASKSSIIFFCDAFGLGLVNNKLLADAYAEGTGLRVYVPAFPASPCPVWVMSYLESAMKPVGWTDVWGQLGRINKGFWVVTTFVPFIVSQRPQLAVPAALEFARKVKAAAGEGAKLGVAGFCWGGYLSTALCAETAAATSEGAGEGAAVSRLVDAHFTAHPSGLKAPEMLVDAVKTHQVPMSLAYPSKDWVLPRRQVEEASRELQKLKAEDPACDYEVRIYVDQAHGFSVRGDSKDKKVLDAIEQARKQAVDWFKKYL